MAEFKTEVKIGAEIDGLKSGINEAQEAIKGLGESVKSSTNGMSESAGKAGESFNSLGYAMKTSLVYGGVYKALSAIKSGLESLTIGALNVASSFEDMEIGMAAVIASTHKNTNAEGEAITSAQKYAWAKTQAAEAVNKLRKANLETPATLGQLTEAFQTALAPAQQLGLSMDQTVKYTTSMTQAAFALKVPMDQLNQEMRAVFEGDTSKNSRINSLLQIKTDALEAHKAAGDLFPFLMSKLEDFASAGQDISHSWSGIKSNIVDVFQTVQSEIGKNFLGEFEKQGLSLQNALQDNAKNIGSAIGGAFKGIYDTGKQVFEAIKVPIISVFNSLYEVVQEIGVLWAMLGDGSAMKVFILGLGTIASAIAIVINGIKQFVDFIGIAALQAQQIFQSADSAEYKAAANAQDKLREHIKGLDTSNGDVVKALAATYGRLDAVAPKKQAEGKGAHGGGSAPDVKDHEETEKEKKKREAAEKKAEAERKRAEKAETAQEKKEEREAEKLAKEILKSQEATTQSVLSNYTTQTEKIDSEYNKRVDKAANAYREDMKEFGSTEAGKALARSRFDAEAESAAIEKANKLKAHNQTALLAQNDIEKQTALSSLQIQMDNLDSSLVQQQITDLQMLEGKKTLEAKKFAIELEYADKRKLLLNGDVEKTKVIDDKILSMKQGYATTLNKTNNQIAEKSGETYRSMMASVTSTIGTSIGQVLNGTMKVKTAMTKILTDLLGMFTQFIGKQIAAHLMGEQTMTAATILGNTTRVASTVWASMVSVATTIGEAIARIGAYAVVAAAGAYAALAGIPIVGPFIAPVAAVAALVAVGSMVKSMASAEGGYDIPNGVNPMTQLHQNEMVLPAEHANTIRNLGANGGGGGGNITIHAVDAKSIKDLFMQHGPALVDSIKNQSRNFNR